MMSLTVTVCQMGKEPAHPSSAFVENHNEAPRIDQYLERALTIPASFLVGPLFVETNFLQY